MPEDLLRGRFGIGGQAIVADAAYLGTGNGDLDVAIARDLILELFVEPGFEFANLTAPQTRHMDVIAWAVRFVVVAIAAEMEKILEKVS